MPNTPDMIPLSRFFRVDLTSCSTSAQNFRSCLKKGFVAAISIKNY